MMIQDCPVEILDKIFECMAYSDLENSQSTLCPLMLTCSCFHTIAKRHVIRIVCLTNAKRVNAFAGYLKQVVESGDYRNSVLPVEHLAVVGKYYLNYQKSTRSSEAEINAKRSIPFIITTAAPSLLTLIIFGMDLGFTPDLEGDIPRVESIWVPDETVFPKLRDLVALEQLGFSVLPRDNGKPDKQAYQLRYPSLRRLYTPGYRERSLVSTLPYLHDVRWLLLDSKSLVPPPPPREEVGHVHSLIIDFRKYRDTVYNGQNRIRQSREAYAGDLGKYQAVIEEVGNPRRNGIVVPILWNIDLSTQGCILSGWADTVVGGDGYWTTAWLLTKSLSAGSRKA